LFSFAAVTRALRSETSELQKGFGRNWSEEMVERLYDYDPADALKSDEAVEIFLSDAFETGDARYIAKAIGVVARAKGMARIARETGLAREQLYKSLSETGNPTLETTLAVLKAVGFELTGRRNAA
jgi:probable addiction module antidote protein